MNNDIELAAAFSLLSHEHLWTLCNLRTKLGLKDKSNTELDSEIGKFLSEGKDDHRLYLAYYFDHNGVEYKFVICVDREDKNGCLFHFGFSRKDNRKIEPSDIGNCMSIIDEVNAKLGTNYGFSYDGLTLHLNPMSVDELKKFLDEACHYLIKISKTESDIWKPKSGFITLTKAKRLINLQ